MISLTQSLPKTIFKYPFLPVLYHSSQDTVNIEQIRVANPNLDKGRFWQTHFGKVSLFSVWTAKTSFQPIKIGISRFFCQPKKIRGFAVKSCFENHSKDKKERSVVDTRFGRNYDLILSTFDFSAPFPLTTSWSEVVIGPAIKLDIRNHGFTQIEDTDRHEFIREIFKSFVFICVHLWLKNLLPEQ